LSSGEIISNLNLFKSFKQKKMKILEIVSSLRLPEISNIIVFNGTHNVPTKEIKTGDIFYANKAWRVACFSFSSLETKEAFLVSTSDGGETIKLPIDNRGVSVATSYQL
jgi:hypothetical protein